MHVHGLTWLQLAARLEHDGRIQLLNGQPRRAAGGRGLGGSVYDRRPERAVALHEAAVTAARAALVALSGE